MSVFQAGCVHNIYIMLLYIVCIYIYICYITCWNSLGLKHVPQSYPVSMAVSWPWAAAAGPLRASAWRAAFLGLAGVAGTSGVPWQPSQVLPCQLWCHGGLVGSKLVRKQCVKHELLHFGCQNLAPSQGAMTILTTVIKNQELCTWWRFDLFDLYVYTCLHLPALQKRHNEDWVAPSTLPRSMATLASQRMSFGVHEF